MTKQYLLFIQEFANWGQIRRTLIEGNCRQGQSTGTISKRGLQKCQDFKRSCVSSESDFPMLSDWDFT